MHHKCTMKLKQPCTSENVVIITTTTYYCYCLDIITYGQNFLV